MIYGIFLEPLFDDLDLRIFVDAYYGNDEVMGRSITWFISVVGSIPTNWSSKRHISVQTSTFRDKFTAINKVVEEAVMLRQHLRYMSMKVGKISPLFFYNMSMVLNVNNHGCPLNNNIMALSYHFKREHVANDMVKLSKIKTKENYADPFTKALVSNEFHGCYH